MSYMFGGDARGEPVCQDKSDRISRVERDETIISEDEMQLKEE